ncbi:hypothetical protein JTB14_012021 [Gonioctena quinquepunctata]|nr:hypothetical protein JTB14_012021 [Gonioctena quinquepunctata]
MSNYRKAVSFPKVSRRAETKLTTTPHFIIHFNATITHSSRPISSDVASAATETESSIYRLSCAFYQTQLEESALLRPEDPVVPSVWFSIATPSVDRLTSRKIAAIVFWWVALVCICVEWRAVLRILFEQGGFSNFAQVGM